MQYACTLHTWSCMYKLCKYISELQINDDICIYYFEHTNMAASSYDWVSPASLIKFATLGPIFVGRKLLHQGPALHTRSGRTGLFSDVAMVWPWILQYRRCGWRDQITVVSSVTMLHFSLLCLMSISPGIISDYLPKTVVGHRWINGDHQNHHEETWKPYQLLTSKHLSLRTGMSNCSHQLRIGHPWLTKSDGVLMCCDHDKGFTWPKDSTNIANILNTPQFDSHGAIP